MILKVPPDVINHRNRTVGTHRLAGLGCNHEWHRSCRGQRGQRGDGNFGSNDEGDRVEVADFQGDDAGQIRGNLELIFRLKEVAGMVSIDEGCLVGDKR